jgi:hypothetical protein
MANRHLAEVAFRQAEARERERRLGLQRQQKETGKVDWLEGMQGLTAAARVRITRDQVEAQTKQEH